MTDQTQTDGMAPQFDLRTARFSIELSDGSTLDDIKLMPGDVVAVEREYDIRASDIEDSAKLEHMLYMVWVAARRKYYPSDFETFIGEVVEMNVDTSGKGTGNPTVPAQ